MSTRILRLSAATLLLASAAVAIAPRMTGHISSSAVVNAPIIAVYAPFDGVIEQASPSIAQPVAEGDTLLVLNNRSLRGSELRALRSSLAAVSGEMSGLTQQSNALERLRKELEDRRAATVDARKRWFVPRLDEAWAMVQHAEATVEASKARLERLEKLSKNGSAPQREVDSARTALLEDRATLASATATMRRLQIERDALTGGSNLDLESNDLEQIGYRLDEIAVRQADIQARLIQLRASRQGLQSQIAGLSIETKKQNAFVPKVTAAGVIWEVSAPEGSSVSIGEPLAQILDCSRRFMEVILPEESFETIVPGTPAQVKYKGATESFTARVAAVYGANTRPNRNMQAAEPRITVDRGLRVIVGIGAVDPSDPKVSRAFCEVGRSAEVRFDRKNTILDAVRALAGRVGLLDQPLVAGLVNDGTETDSRIN
ncbi:Multidrug resistance efflux pump [Palleronia pelagia]|uniref:Multidrug resistance efflux pump n=2 Tax=Palleronia pelagia TaxID=387096 RepID=A0A1H8JAI8_9RHOB|nr:Multidrug resistance efflux pump [Palleronia pelagia]